LYFFCAHNTATISPNTTTPLRFATVVAFSVRRKGILRRGKQYLTSCLGGKQQCCAFDCRSVSVDEKSPYRSLTSGHTMQSPVGVEKLCV
jgi:hypothetical protein